MVGKTVDQYANEGIKVNKIVRTNEVETNENVELTNEEKELGKQFNKFVKDNKGKSYSDLEKTLDNDAIVDIVADMYEKEMQKMSTGNTTYPVSSQMSKASGIIASKIQKSLSKELKTNEGEAVGTKTNPKFYSWSKEESSVDYKNKKQQELVNKMNQTLRDYVNSFKADKSKANVKKVATAIRNGAELVTEDNDFHLYYNDIDLGKVNDKLLKVYNEFSDYNKEWWDYETNPNKSINALNAEGRNVETLNKKAKVTASDIIDILVQKGADKWQGDRVESESIYQARNSDLALKIEDIKDNIDNTKNSFVKKVKGTIDGFKEAIGNVLRIDSFSKRDITKLSSELRIEKTNLMNEFDDVYSYLLNNADLDNEQLNSLKENRDNNVKEIEKEINEKANAIFQKTLDNGVEKGYWEYIEENIHTKIKTEMNFLRMN